MGEGGRHSAHLGVVSVVMFYIGLAVGEVDQPDVSDVGHGGCLLALAMLVANLALAYYDLRRVKRRWGL